MIAAILMMRPVSADSAAPAAPGAPAQFTVHAAIEGLRFVFTSPLQLVFPGLAIMLTVLAFNLVGDGLRDALGRETFEVKEVEE